MSTYYFLMNDTKRERIHLDYHVKHGPMTRNAAVHFAMCNYMFENLGDTLRLCGDDTDEGDNYIEVDLLTYKFKDAAVIVKIVALLNAIYESETYAVIDGSGVILIPN